MDKRYAWSALRGEVRLSGCLRWLGLVVVLLVSLGGTPAFGAGVSLTYGVDGAGAVALSPAGGSYPRRSTVTLTATPAPGWAFERWGGDISSTQAVVKVKMVGPKDVIAFFRCVNCGAFGDNYVVGQTYVGRNQYVEYHAGNLPIVISAPHGGYLTPDEIPDRQDGTTTGDGWTEELARQVFDAIHTATGGYPHLIICRLDRVKLDANREVEEAAEGNPYAIQAWEEYHQFIEDATGRVEQNFGKGLYIDLHGQSDDPDRLQLGYLLLATELALSDATLNDPAYADLSSINYLADHVELPFADLLRGATSLGGLFEDAGYPSVPSPVSPGPGRTMYYSGGYSTEVHGSRDVGRVDGIQIESNMAVRESEEARASFGEVFAEVVQTYLATYYGL